MVATDDPAIAEAIVVHGEALCEKEDHLWDVLSKLLVPTDKLTDRRDQGKCDFETEEVVRAFLYQEIRGYSGNKLAEVLQERTVLLKNFGFDVRSLDEAPRQQTLNNARKKFSDATIRIIEAAAVGIADAAVEHDVIKEGLVPVLDTEEEEEDDEEETKREAKRKKTGKTIKLARKHAFPEFKSGRALNRTYEDEEILDMVARACAYTGSAHSEGEYGWLTDDDLTADGSTILRVLKEFATAEGRDAEYTLDDFLGEDVMPKIDKIQDTIMESFDDAIENILSTIRGSGPFSDRRNVAAIDSTHEQFHVSPWINKDEGIPKPDYPKMVSGYKDNDDNFIRAYKYATITLAGDLVPIILGVEPIKENSQWEEDNAESYPKADYVGRLLDKAEQYVDIDEVFLDRGFHSTAVYAAIEERGITYTAPLPKYEDDYKAIKKVKQHPTADAAVNHDAVVATNGEIHHEVELMYVPSREEEGKYAVFITNRDYVDPEDVIAVCNRYSRRWDIENQYKSLKDCMPRTSSKDYRVRFCRYVITALIYNLWRLTDYLVKVAQAIKIRSPPEVTFKTFVRALGNFLREIG